MAAERPHGGRIHILSLGAGVQSTTMALMAAHGEIAPMPAAAIFADTGAEPASVYRHLDWLCEPGRLPFPVHRVTAGNLRQEIYDAAARKRGAWGRSPFFIRNENGALGMIRRQCTGDYKIDPINRELRRLANVPPRARPKDVRATQWIGISLDEAHRMQPAGFRWIETRWPLIEKRMSRWDCLKWMERRGYPAPPKSACTFCPYRSDFEWRRIRNQEPGAWADAVAVDHVIRAGMSGVKAEAVYVHRSGMPLEDVDLSTAAERGQPDLFGNDCEGVCGL